MEVCHIWHKVFFIFTTNQFLNCSVKVFELNFDMSTDDTFSTTVLLLGLTTVSLPTSNAL